MCTGFATGCPTRRSGHSAMIRRAMQRHGFETPLPHGLNTFFLRCAGIWMDLCARFAGFGSECGTSCLLGSQRHLGAAQAGSDPDWIITMHTSALTNRIPKPTCLKALNFLLNRGTKPFPGGRKFTHKRNGLRRKPRHNHASAATKHRRHAIRCARAASTSPCSASTSKSWKPSTCSWRAFRLGRASM